MKMEDINNIGSRIKDRRKRMSLTISEMAMYTGLSIGYLSNIERNQTSPTLGNLKTICEALGVTITDMIRTDIEEKTLVRKKDMVIREFPDFNHTVRVIDFGRNEGVYEYITVRPGKAKVVMENKHPFDEIGTVLQGSLVVMLEGERYELNKGDSIYVKARSRHSIINETEKICESFWHYKKIEE